MEEVHIRRRTGQAKVLGTLVAFGGAMVLAWCRGPSIVNLKRSIFQEISTSLEELQLGSDSSWQLGAFCLLGNSATWAIWIVLQAHVLRNYPAPVSATAFSFSLATAQLAVVAVCIERDLSTWAHTFLSDVTTIVYGGLVTSGIAMTLHSWAVHRGGPVLVAAYQPLQTIIVAILGSLFLGESLHVGSILGSVLIIVGLYFVMWGKSVEGKPAGATEELNKSNEDFLSSSIGLGATEPLLDVTMSRFDS